MHDIHNTLVLCGFQSASFRCLTYFSCTNDPTSKLMKWYISPTVITHWFTQVDDKQLCVLLSGIDRSQTNVLFQFFLIVMNNETTTVDRQTFSRNLTFHKNKTFRCIGYFLQIPPHILPLGVKKYQHSIWINIL